MSLNSTLFRTVSINNLNDLVQIGMYNIREKKVYKSNPDINMKLSKNIKSNKMKE